MAKSDFGVLIEKWLNMPLYNAESGELKPILDQVKRLTSFDGRHETYCPRCKKDAIFLLPGDAKAASWALEDENREKAMERGVVRLTDEPSMSANDPRVRRWLGPFEVVMQCTRVESHFVWLNFQLEVSTKLDKPTEGKLLKPIEIYRLTKYGQWPSLVDFHLHQMDGLADAFSEVNVKEWKRSLMTQAHGFNVAACVHLRRMFESLLLEARDSVDGGTHKDKEWPDFDGAPTPERVRLLASELPPFIVEHPELYGVLSKGVHQLTEQECFRELPVLQQCMRLIAEQRIDKRRRAKNEEETKKLLAEAASRLGRRS